MTAALTLKDRGYEPVIFEKDAALGGQLNVADKPRIDVKDEKLFFKMVKSAFAQRRKTISNSITSGLSLSKDDFKTACENADVSPTARAEALTLEELGRLADAIYDIK